MNVRNRVANAPEVVARFYTYLEISKKLSYAGTPCHIWTGGKSRGGERYSDHAFYGTFNPGGIDGEGNLINGGVRAHVYIAWVHGLIPALRLPTDHNIDHRCHQSLCCNPFHLEVVPGVVNQRRRIDRARAMKAERAFDASLHTIGWVLVASALPGQNTAPPF